MKLTQLKVFKSGKPVTLGKKVRKDCRIFTNETLNRMIEENMAEVRRKGHAELKVPSGLHPVRPDCLTENARAVADTLHGAGFRAYRSNRKRQYPPRDRGVSGVSRLWAAFRSIYRLRL